MANPITNTIGKVRRDLIVRIPAGLAATTNVLIGRFMRPIKVKSVAFVSEDAGTGPDFTAAIEASAAEDANKDPGAYAALHSASTLLEANVGRRVSPTLTSSDCVAGASLRCVLTRAGGTLGAMLIHVEFEDDLD